MCVCVPGQVGRPCTGRTSWEISQGKYAGGAFQFNYILFSFLAGIYVSGGALRTNIDTLGDVYHLS